jgi:hypothetical protein
LIGGPKVSLFVRTTVQKSDWYLRPSNSGKNIWKSSSAGTTHWEHKNWRPVRLRMALSENAWKNFRASWRLKLRRELLAAEELPLLLQQQLTDSTVTSLTFAVAAHVVAHDARTFPDPTIGSRFNVNVVT